MLTFFIPECNEGTGRRSRKDGRLNLPVAELAVEPRLLYSERQQRETLLIFISGSSLLADD